MISNNEDAARQIVEQGSQKFMAGHLDAALAHFDGALMLHPLCTLAWINRGAVRDRLGDYTGAVADFTAALAIDPRLAVAYNNRGGSRMALWEFDAAIADLDSALALNPQNWKAYLMRGYARYHKRDLAGAEADYRAAFEIEPMGAAQVVVGQIVQSLRTSERAVFGDCENHLRDNTGDFHSLARRGLARLLQSHDREAQSDFAEYRRLNGAGDACLDLLIQEAKRQRTAARNDGTTTASGTAQPHE